MANGEIIQRIQQNSARGEEIVKFIQKELPLLKQNILKKRQEQLAGEIQEKNSFLKAELEYWMNRVVELEVMSGVKQYPSTDSNPSITKAVAEVPISSTTESKETPVSKSEKHQKPAIEQQVKKEPSLKGGKKEKQPKTVKSEKPPSDDNKEVNVSRLDLRIGRILNARKHPDAESLYVEEIDIGEEKPRTVVSGLVKFVPLEEMQNRLVVVLCNLKPAKMRGITSEAMVMCASTPEKVEILRPPSDSTPGDRVVCEDYPGEPDSLLNPKKKVFEQVAPDLKTDGSCNATYKTSTLKVAGKGVVKSTSLTNVQIK